MRASQGAAVAADTEAPRGSAASSSSSVVHQREAAYFAAGTGLAPTHKDGGLVGATSRAQPRCVSE